MALLQTGVVFVAVIFLLRVTRRYSGRAGVSETDARIDIRNLVVDYGEVRAVDGVCFSVGRGRAGDVAGPIGLRQDHDAASRRRAGGSDRRADHAGRQHCLFGVDAAQHAGREARVSMVFQSYAIWPHMTVFDNVAYGLKRAQDVRGRDRGQRVRGCWIWCRCGDFADRPASKLSGGQQQRVAVARAIAFSPEVLLFDEPLSNLDAKLRVSMRVELRELQKELGITALYVTHDQEEALAISDRVIVMNAGGSSRSARRRTSTAVRAPCSWRTSWAMPT